MGHMGRRAAPKVKDLAGATLPDPGRLLWLHLTGRFPGLVIAKSSSGCRCGYRMASGAAGNISGGKGESRDLLSDKVG